MFEDKANAMVSYKNDTLWVGGGVDKNSNGNLNFGYSHFVDYYHHCYPSYPVYPTVINNLQVVKANSTETAYNIVTRLIEKGFLKNVTVKQFTTLVKEIVDTLE